MKKIPACIAEAAKEKIGNFKKDIIARAKEKLKPGTGERASATSRTPGYVGRE
jgi:hypothetical protein